MSDRPLRPYQVEAIDAVEREWQSRRSTLLVMPTGCHRIGQELLRFNGEIVRVEDVVAGDQLMGPDGTPRTVMGLCRGRGNMVEVQPIKGEPWVVNEDHILTLVRTEDGRGRGGELVDVTCKEWATWSKTRKHLHKLFRAQLWGKLRPLHPGPYLLGVLLGDGCLRRQIEVTTPDEELVHALRCTADTWGMRLREGVGIDRCPTYVLAGDSGRSNLLIEALRKLGVWGCLAAEKFIPPEYKTAETGQRLDLLAGLIDTDGHLTCGGYDYVSKSETLARDVAFVARSVGLAAYVTRTEKWCQTGGGGVYWRVSISGDCSRIPCLVKRKQAPRRRQKKDPLRTGFSLQWLGHEEDYYGFTLDGDQRYLLADFTVTHNTGKTRTFTEVLRRRQVEGRALVLAHRQELLTQAGGAIESDGGLTWELERAEHRATVHGLLSASDVVVATVQTLKGRRLERWPADAFATIIVDEAHHAAAKSYRTILKHFAGAQVLGVTATPDRGDDVGLGTVFESVAYQYEMREAIRAGYLVPIVQKTIQCADLDLSDIKTRSGDLAQNELEQALSLDAVHHQIASPLVELTGTRQTIVFCAGVDQAHQLAQVLAAYVPSERVSVIDGTTPSKDREEILADYSAGKVQYLLNCAVLTEGFDAPATACVAMARPTKSRALYAQCLGRGTRIAPGKTDVLVLDFVGNAGRHTLVTPLDVLAGKPLPEDQKRDAEEAMAQGMSAEDALAQAEEWAAERMRKAEAERRRARVQAQVAYRAKAIDPFRMLGAEGAPERGPRATDRQLELLKSKGIELDKTPSRAEASKLIDGLMDRRKRGLCTFKQARQLAKRGLRTDLTFDQAKWALDQIASNGWQAPREVLMRFGAGSSNAA